MNFHSATAQRTADSAQSAQAPQPVQRATHRGLRLAAASLLAFLALGLVFEARRARQVGGDVLARQVVVGDTSYLRADPANADDFEPFSFAVLGPVRGDDAVLERALRREPSSGAVGLTVLVGDVARAGRPDDYVRMTAAVGDASVVSAAGAADMDPQQADAFGAYVSAPRWWFVRNGCLFVGVPGDAPEDRTFVREAIAGDVDSRHVFLFHGGEQPTVEGRVTEVFGPTTVGALRHVTVGADDVVTQDVALSTLPTLGSLDRSFTLDVLHPLVGDSTPAYVALLAGCALMLSFAGRLAFGGRGYRLHSGDCAESPTDDAQPA